MLDEEGRAIETPEEQRLAELVTGDPPLTRVDADVMVLVAETFLATESVPSPGDSALVMVHADLDALADPPGGEHSERSEKSSESEESGKSQECEESDEPQQRARADLAGSSPSQRSLATRPPTGTTADGTPLTRATLLRLLCESPAQLMVHARDGRPLDLGRTRRHASRRQRRALRERDGSCRFPGCTQRHRLVPHHTVWWSRGGPTNLDLLVSLCPTHHRAVHEIGYSVTATGDGRFRFRRPDGRELDPTDGMSDDGSARPVSAGPIEPTWGGERLDLQNLITGMAGNLLIGSGVRLLELRGDEMDVALRRAAGWPFETTAA